MLLDDYLVSSDYINWEHPAVLEKANQLASSLQNTAEIAKSCFEFVRDEIKHSWDYCLNPVTIKASDVLHYGTGFCYAKSHLLAALLRANNIPCGLCYQRLTIADDRAPFCLHGLNAIYLEPWGWYRVDARGNKDGVNAQFRPPHEQLAFSILIEGEANLPEIWAEPMPVVVDALKRHSTFDAVAEHLPDVAL
ncbi:MAG: transglutaminase family protein [Proteobacteria bacterium]|nr:transglutaminase family protein [Pseudomonadota bacterium]